MTSSLVGSEMCIRDRVLVDAEQPLVEQWCLGIKRDIAAVFPDSNGDVSVSYTHLTLPTICSV
eukprot:2969964-Prorocentrum_lima.AAC.1